VHHLADSHLIAFARTKQMLAEDEPKLFAYDQDEWAKTADSASASPIAASLMILRGVHERWALLLGALPESAWTRKGIHFRRGAMTLDDLLELYARHGDNHIKQIADLRSERGW